MTPAEPFSRCFLCSTPHKSLENRLPHSSASDDATSSELTLRPPEGQTTQEVLQENESKVFLPLPDEDRADMERKLAVRRRSRLSLAESLGLVTLISGLFAMTHWLRLDFYALGLGCFVIFVLLGAVDRWFSSRAKVAVIAIALTFYVVTALILLFS